MKMLGEWWRVWREDRLLQDIVRNTGYLFSSSSLSIVLGMVQSIFAARLLGVERLGILGTITVFASTLNRLFSFRMGELVVKYLGEYLVEKRHDRGGALVKAAALAEATSSILAFLLLFLLAPLAAQYLAKDPTTTILFRLYGISILGSLTAETSIGVLQLDNRFRSQAVINWIQSSLTALIILAAYITDAGMLLVLVAYLLGKLILGIGPAIIAWRSLKRLLGSGWWRTSFSLLPSWRELSRFALSTNMSATVNLIVRDSEILWVSYFLSPLEAGYYKIALAIINLVVMPITPFISTTYPEISRSIATRKWSQLRHLLRRVTFISGGWTGLAGIGLVLFGKWVILLYGAEYLPAYSCILILLVGFGVANTLFWNRPLLLAFGLPTYPFLIMTIAGLGKVLLAFLLVPRVGYQAEAALLSLYFIISVGLIVRRGLKEFRQAEIAYPERGVV